MQQYIFDRKLTTRSNQQSTESKLYFINLATCVTFFSVLEKLDTHIWYILFKYNQQDVAAVWHTSSHREHAHTPNVMLPHHHIDFYIFNKF